MALRGGRIENFDELCYLGVRHPVFKTLHYILEGVSQNLRMGYISK